MDQSGALLLGHLAVLPEVQQIYGALHAPLRSDLMLMMCAWYVCLNKTVNVTFEAL